MLQWLGWGRSKRQPIMSGSKLSSKKFTKKFFKQFYLILVVCMPLISKCTPDIIVIVEVILRNDLPSTEGNSICWENLLHMRYGLITTHADIKELSHHYWCQHQWILYCFCTMRFLLAPKPKWAQPPLGDFALSDN